ncbi:hypothetical protein Peur_010622 [Populus x canadensis]
MGVETYNKQSMMTVMRTSRGICRFTQKRGNVNRVVSSGGSWRRGGVKENKKFSSAREAKLKQNEKVALKPREPCKACGHTLLPSYDDDSPLNASFTVSCKKYRLLFSSLLSLLLLVSKVESPSKVQLSTFI